jgi:dienelactone hydrolase
VPLFPACVVTLTTLSLLIAAAPAAARQAEPAPGVRWAAGSPALRRAQTIATAYWGRPACGGRVSMSWAAQAPSLNAVASWDSPLPATGDPRDNTNCRIVLNTGATFTWPKLCTVVAHEYGHLLGHVHGADGLGVMSPMYRAPLPACATER